jgi:hypothetical protein
MMKYLKNTKLCPISLGVAIGITSALVIFIGFVWMMNTGVPPILEKMPPITWGVVWYYTFCALIKGFIFGFIVALIYDLMQCAMAKCCRKESTGCGCDNCPCGTKESKVNEGHIPTSKL